MTVPPPQSERNQPETVLPPCAGTQTLSPAATRDPALSGHRVLIVEHQEDVRRELKQFMGGQGFRVDESHDSSMALGDILRAQNSPDSYSAVFLDASLPRLSGFDLVDLLRGACQNLPTFVMVLAAGMRDDQTLRCQAAALPYSLAVPIVETELMGILSKWQTVSNPAAASTGSSIARLPATVPSFSASILLVEDNLINQQVAKSILKKMGCTVTIANNGLEAVQATEKSQFDLVFMDIQMPEMDGLDATRAIRSRERLVGGHLPIVTLTAHALDRDRLQCFDAGVDDFLTKPVRREEIQKAVQKYVVERFLSPSVAVEPVTSAPSGSHMLSLVDDDTELLGRLAMILTDSIPKQMANLKDAIGSSDFALIQEISHKVKGAMAQLDATAAKNAAHAIEVAAKAQDLNGVGCHLPTLAAEAQALLVELRPFLTA